MTELLKCLPSDLNMAYVIVQHLAPNHESILPQLLSKSTAMPVEQVKDNTPVRANHVYIIPPPKDMEILDGTLKLIPRLPSPNAHMPIDIFLRSLAQVYAGKAIGVILSGTGTDGALGMQDVKNYGGITFVQEPSSAKFDGMPRSALLTGSIDFSLPLSEIAQKLVQISRHPSFEELKAKEPEQEEPRSDAIVAIIGMLKSLTGVDFTHYKQNTIHRRIQRRMILQNCGNVEQYADSLRNNRAELTALYQDILIKVTNFFRDPDLFEALKKQVFPEMLKNKSQEIPVRFWVPGCSTGEEVYSLAISLIEYMNEENKSLPVQIFGTDLSEKAIEFARAGRYIDNIAVDVSEDRLRRFFIRSDSHYQVSKSIRDICVFSRQNLIKDPPFSRLDLISCRNLLIYLQPVLQKKIMPLFHFGLNPTGVLVLGVSEMPGNADLFTPRDKKHKIFTKNTVREAHPQFSLNRRQAEDVKYEDKSVRVQDEAAVPDSQKELDRILIQRFSPTAVLVNDTLDILQLRGEASRYLAITGAASFNLTKMSPDSLVLELIKAINEAKNKSGFAQNKVKIRHKDQYVNFNIEVIPVLTAPGKQQRFAILFNEIPFSAEAPKEPVASPKAASQNLLQEDVVHLKQELESAKIYLKSIIDEREVSNEELQSANEEILSSNEELQSINEELQTAKEELQSTNEELVTLNEELNTRNTELGRVNSDLLNLIASVQIPIVMLSSDFKIRRYSPLAEKVLNLIATDIGRPISDIRLRVDVPDIEKLVLESIETVSVRTSEVQDIDGRWYSVMVRPYKSVDNKIDGAVLTFIDIDMLKRGTDSLAVQSEQLQATNKELENFVDAVAQDLRVPLRHALTYLQALTRDYWSNLNLQGKTYLELTEDSIQKMSETFNDVLSLTRIMRGSLIKEDIDLSVLAERIVTDIRNCDLKRKIDFSIEQGMSLQADSRLMTIVLENLFMKAWNYTGKEGQARIEFGTKKESDKTVYFIRAVRASFKDTSPEGLDQGLATPKRILAQYNGRLWFQQDKQAATFFFMVDGYM